MDKIKDTTTGVLKYSIEKEQAVLVTEYLSTYNYWFRIDDGYILCQEPKRFLGEISYIDFCQNLTVVTDGDIIIVDNRVDGIDK
jgi:hypothetical protein